MNLADYLKSNPKKHIIFDFDETIAKLDLDWHDWHPGTAKIFMQFDPKFRYRSGQVAHLTNIFVKRYGEKIRRQLVKFNENYETKFTKGLIPNKKLIEFIKNNRNYALHIFSSNSRKTIDWALKRLDLVDKFTTIVTREDVVYIKPDPDGFKHILKNGVLKNEYLMVGDSDKDEEAAKLEGIDFFKVEMS